MGQVSAADILQFLSQAVYVVIFVFALIRVIRWPVRSNLDIALFFGAAALTITLGWIEGVAHLAPGLAVSTVGVALILALPYLLLRLVEDFGSVPPVLTRLAELGLLVSVVGFFLLRSPPPFWFLGPVVLYFVAFSVYDAAAFIREARRTRGVTSRRMQSIAAGSLFLGLDVLLAGVQSGALGLASYVAMVSPLLGLASAVAYFVGFAPPLWLRRAWQAPEFRSFVRRTVAATGRLDTDELGRELEQGAADAVGAPGATLMLWDPAARQLRFTTDGEPFSMAPEETVAGRVFLAQRPRFVADMPRANPGQEDEYRAHHLHAALIAPVTSGQRHFGVLTVYSSRAPLFADDDLDLVQTLADQAAVVLENRTLIDEAVAARARAEALASAEAERQRVNAELEVRVSERTAELRAAMAELESFSYSVSHDLRAPLRTIDGFSQALLEDCFAELGPDGQDSLRRIRAACQRMGDLIDGLLRLSRVTRTELRWETVNLSEMARGIAADLQRGQPERRVSFAIQDGLVAKGDPQLLRIAMDNLLGNAWKFSSKQAEARIEFFRAAPDNVGPGGREMYVVRDNGAGFDMAFAGKLFGPFQRLHGRHEFEGTGIGLATVQRIIHRHGGRVWAEGVVDRGATFAFTLGSPVEVDERPDAVAPDKVEAGTGAFRAGTPQSDGHARGPGAR